MLLTRNRVIAATSVLFAIVLIVSWSLQPGASSSSPASPSAFSDDAHGSPALADVDHKSSNTKQEDKQRQPQSSPSSGADQQQRLLDQTDVAGECYRGEKQWWRAARCPPDEWWLEPWAKLRSAANPPRKRWTLVAVGANKGYGLTSWHEQLVGTARTKYTAKSLGIALFNKTKQFGTMSHCGGCCECVEAPIVVADKNVADSVKIIAFEPGPATARHLREFFDDPEVFDIRWKAVSEKSGSAFFPDVPLGKETGHLVSGGGGGGDDSKHNGNKETAAAAGGGEQKVPSNSKFKLAPVKVVALDDELETLYRSFPDQRGREQDDAVAKHDADQHDNTSSSSEPLGVDVLQTDVEGFDQDVARGARKLLSSGKVGVYIFEMNRAENYTTVFSWLHDVAGFECYFGTERRFIQNRWRRIPPFVRVTGRCWKPEYEHYSGWINAVCVHRERAKELLPVFGKLTHQRWKINMMCAGKKRQNRVVGRFLHQHLREEMREWKSKEHV